MPRSILALVCLVLAAIAAEPAGAATRTATDREAGVRFTLSDRSLRVRILDRAPRRVRRQLYGERVVAACQRYDPIVRVVDRRRWPRGERTVRFRFNRNISLAVSWCLLEHRRGGDIAFANFRR